MRRLDRIGTSSIFAVINRHPLGGATFFIFLVSLVFFIYLFAKTPLLHDGDSYFHLSVARIYTQEGFIDQLDWARYSVMNQGYGDKEFLFHLLLMPFVKWLPSDWGGKIALAVLNAVVAAMIANLSVRAIGKWGIFVPVWVFGTSAAFTLRMSRLRPEILSLIVLICATWAASRNKYRWLLVFSALYALSYTAFHVLIGLSFGWFIVFGWVYRRWEWRIPVYTIFGAAIGLALHPHFPTNLNIWAIQNIDFFLLKNKISVGNEIRPAPIATIISLNLGWLIGLVVFWRSTKKAGVDSNSAGPECFFLINAITFTLLYLAMQRFSIYCIPFVTLALFFGIKHRNAEMGRWTYLPWRGRLPFAVTFSLCLCTSILSAWYVYVNLRDHSVFDTAHRRDWQALGQVIPAGAKVAAPWDASELYVWAAPQGRYLNLLDPIFMFAAHPQAFTIQRNIWNGSEPDVPLALKRHLDSDYIAFPYQTHFELFKRLSADPRMRLIYLGYTAVFQLKPYADSLFVTDWKAVQTGESRPQQHEDLVENAGFNPGSSESSDTAHGVYITGNNDFNDTQCVNRIHTRMVSTPVKLDYEISSYGGYRFWLDNKLIITHPAPGRAVLGRGARVTLELGKGSHVFSIQTCPHEGRNGFYFLQRGQTAD